MISMMEDFKLSEAGFKRQVSDCHIEEISDSFCEKWRSLPPYLEMETIVAKDIDRDHTGSDECEKRCSFLKKWKKLKGQKATYKCLISALLRMKCREEAEGVCRLLKKHDISSLSCGNSQTAADSSLSVKSPDTKGWWGLATTCHCTPLARYLALIMNDITESAPKMYSAAVW